MQLGTRLRYGMRSMIHLAKRGSSEPARAKDIALAQGLSKGYLEGLLATLRRAGLVRGVRGPGGGWLLARPASRISPAEVYVALEGATALAPCVADGRLCPAGHEAACARRLWVRMTRGIEKALKEETLAVLSGAGKSDKTKRAGSRSRQRAKAAAARKRTARGKTTRARTARRPRTVIKARRARSKVVRVPARGRLRRSA